MSSKTVLSQIKNATESKSSPSSLPRVATLQAKKKTTTVPFGFASLPCGEKISKNHKCFAASGSLEEAIGLIGRLKAVHFNLEDASARKMFIFARLTKIQEDLISIVRSLTTTALVSGKHTTSRFPMDRVKDIDEAITSLGSSMYTGTPGITLIEADLYCIWAVVRRCERQVIAAKDPQLGLSVEESAITYLNRLSDYFSMLIVHMSGRF